MFTGLFFQDLRDISLFLFACFHKLYIFNIMIVMMLLRLLVVGLCMVLLCRASAEHDTKQQQQQQQMEDVIVEEEDATKEKDSEQGLHRFRRFSTHSSLTHQMLK